MTDLFPELVRFIAVTAIALITVGTCRIAARLIGPTGAADIQETRLRQDRKALTGDHSHD